MKIHKGHLQTGVTTFLLAISGQYGITEFIGNTKLSSTDRQSILDESFIRARDYIKSSEYNNDFHKTKFLEFLNSADAERYFKSLSSPQIMTEDDRKRWIKLMRKYNFRFPEDNVWNLDTD